MLLLIAANMFACAPPLTDDVISAAIFETAPFDKALAVIVPRTIAAPCDKLPATQDSQAWAVLTEAGFMSAEPKGDDSCELELTDRGAARKMFGRIVTLDSTYEVPVGMAGTDLPAEFKKSESGDSATVVFTWRFYRFRGVDGLLALDKLPQRKSVVRIAEVPPFGTGTATFRRDDSSWTLEGIKLRERLPSR